MRAVIVGCGRVGAGLAERLARAGHEVTIIDISSEAFGRLEPDFPGQAVRADGTEEDVLRRAGTEGADWFFALTEGDNRNVLAAQMAAETFGVKQCRGQDQRPGARRGLHDARHRHYLPHAAAGRRAGAASRPCGRSRRRAAFASRNATTIITDAPRPPRRLSNRAQSSGALERMYIVVVGGGKVGYFLSKELLEAGHELVILEKNAGRARQIADELGSIVLNRDGCEGKHLAEAGANRAAIVAAVTGDDEDNLVVCQMAKHHFDVPRTIARVNNPQERGPVPPPRRGRDHQPDAHGAGVDRAGHPGPRAAASGAAQGRRARASRGADRRGLTRDRPPAIRHPAARGLLAVRAAARQQPSSRSAGDTVFQAGDKVLAIASGRATRSCGAS